jgi:hypothetical protein
VLPYKRRTASTASYAKFSLSYVNNLELKVVLAIFKRSFLKSSSFYELSDAFINNSTNI